MEHGHARSLDHILPLPHKLSAVSESRLKGAGVSGIRDWPDATWSSSRGQALCLIDPQAPVTASAAGQACGS